MTDPETPGLGIERWTTAEQSKYEPFELEFPKCLRERGCPFERAELEPCPASIEALTVAQAREVAERPHFAPTHLFITGYLLALPTRTALGCEPNTCCNRASAKYMLTDDGSNWNAGNTFFVSSPRRAFRCLGDDSALCCDFPNVRVIAFARVRGQDLFDLRLCRL